MLSFAMHNPPGGTPRTTLTKAQCEEALDLFENGVMNGAQIARHLGVSRHVIYRYFKAVGAIEGRLIHEHMLRQHAEIDARQHARRMQQQASRTFSKVNMGFLHSQAASTDCSVDRATIA